VPSDNELSSICRSCGLCCDGTLYPAGRLEGGEVERALRTGLRVVYDEDRSAFEQPCARFDRSAGGCTIYADRPATCRRFVCALLARARAGQASVDDAIAAVAFTHHLITLSAGDPSPQLEARLAADFSRADTD
jgi:hypothetical protein